MEPTIAKKERIDVVDALRGFAIVSILLLHNLEHFDCLYYPEMLPDWLKAMDATIMSTMFFLFGGKSYSIFALLFGFTFFIQDSHQREKGKDFRARFAWRLLLLFIFSIFNTVFFQGDILTLFAILGLLLIPTSRLKDSVVLALMIFLLIQPYEIGSLIAMWINPDAQYHMTNSSIYFSEATRHMHDTSFIGMLQSNLGAGKKAVLMWNLENGRIFQIPGLFLAGMLIGRNKLFVSSEKSTKFWRKAFLFGFVAFAIFFLLKNSGIELFAREDMNVIITKLFGFWSNLGMTAMIIGLFFSLYQIETWKKSLNIFIPIGKMALTCYIFSSIFGFFVYYGCSLGLYAYTGATVSFFIGLFLVTMFWLFCYYYGKSHKHGPLEHIWHKLTWLKS